jgi:nicotinate-nucleotide adenylyltransferase
MTKRLGVFGGTFDPPHLAHVAAAIAVRDACALDEVLMVVAADPWQKRGAVIAAAADRLAMVRAAVEGVDRVTASDLEIARGGATYTVDTVHELTAPDRELFVVVGADLVPRLDTWDRVEELRAACTLVVINRYLDVAEPPPGWRVDTVHVPEYDLTSTEVRRRLAAGEPVDDLVAPAVRQVIHDRGLYTVS